MEKLAVIFRVYNRKHDPWYGEVVAIFPTDIANPDGNVTCYDMSSGHGAGNYSYMVSDLHPLTRPATDEEAAPLLKHLIEVVGYDNLKVYKKMTSKLRDIYLKNFYDLRKEMRNGTT